MNFARCNWTGDTLIAAAAAAAAAAVVVAVVMTSQGWKFSEFQF